MATHLEGVQSLYRLAAPLYDGFRASWIRLTPSVEAELDCLITSRVRGSAHILELAPGTGVNLSRLQRLRVDFDRYLGIDASPRMLNRAHRKAGSDPRIELRQGDLLHLEEVLGEFDLILSTWLLAHVEEPCAMVRAALERLIPSGTAIFVFSTPPRSRAVRRIARAIYRMGAARLVDPAPLLALPELEHAHVGAGGLATLLVFRAPDPPAREHR